MASFDFSTLTAALVVLTFGGIGITIYLVLSYQSRTQKEIRELTSRMGQLEREFLKTKPEVDTIRSALDDRVDYAAMEKKLKELILFVGEKIRQKK